MYRPSAAAGHPIDVRTARCPESPMGRSKRETSLPSNMAFAQAIPS